MPEWSVIPRFIVRKKLWLQARGARGYWLTRAPCATTTKKIKPMNTIKCGLKLNEQHTGIGVGVTPAEALVLNAIHYPGVNDNAEKPQFPVIVSPVADGVALTEDSPSVPAEEQRLNPLTGKVIPAVPAIPAKTHERTDAEELARLKRKYTQTLDGDPKKHIVTQLFPGIAPKLPATFEEIGLKIAAPEKTAKE